MFRFEPLVECEDEEMVGEPRILNVEVSRGYSTVYLHSVEVSRGYSTVYTVV